MDDESDRESIRYLLMLICKLSRDRSRVLMSEIGIHCGQGIALRQLWRKDGVTQSELAHGLHVAPATVTISLQRMERIGLIKRRSDQRDQRVTRVFLTDRGRSLRENVEKKWHRLEEQMLVGFSDKDRNAMREHLLRIRANLDDVA